MIRRIVNSLYHRYNHCPCVGQWFATSNGHVLRVCLVSTESQKVVCELLGRNYTISYPLVVFQSGKMFKRLGGVL
ncbi:hypothetical protein UZ962_18345 [Escherichia coli]|uniref:hypothetical protein n=1 Tax=Escherichia coli TaxID=562 RepID=UPI0011EE94F4|nr:hypothetical protein [Escherichia coli]KAA0610838.1 hypothetical protein E2K68_18810 [Escherichia coli]KAA0637025.1 hypothetical protein E2K67_09995 [Escherichia coli]MDY9197513.1 hypothetical protein [Escherichia coli]MDY9211969.1 hypothetical protein [Escherichia coli]MDY9266527.1 hypothetical protein [Escherichia coli]